MCAGFPDTYVTLFLHSFLTKEPGLTAHHLHESHSLSLVRVPGGLGSLDGAQLLSPVLCENFPYTTK